MARPRLVLFDIGSTLWSSPPEDPGALQMCYEKARDALLEVLPDAPSVEELVEAVEGYFGEWEEIWRADPNRVTQSPTTDFVAEALMRRFQMTLPAEALAAFTDALLETSIYTAIAEAPEQGMSEALAALQERGLRLGCVSNAFMTADGLMRIMHEKGLGPYLDLTVSSCEFGHRKPHPSIYQEALDRFGVSGAETIFVGDRLDADVEGPSKLGMRTVLTTQYRAEDPATAKVPPDHVIDHLSGLVLYIDGLLAEE